MCVFESKKAASDIKVIILLYKRITSVIILLYKRIIIIIKLITGSV